MALTTLSGQQSDFTLSVDKLSPQLRVVRFEGHEAISSLFRFHLTLASTEKQIKLEDVVGKSASLRLQSPHGTRKVHGIVSRFEMSGQSQRFGFYEAELVPEIALLGLRTRSRVHPTGSVPEILEKALGDGKIAKDRFKFSLRDPKAYPQREFVVQYRESDLDFLSRRLEEEGIYYFFQHDDKAAVLVMADMAEATVAVGDKATEQSQGQAFKIPLVPKSGAAPEKELVLDFRRCQELRSAQVLLRDFCWEKPSTIPQQSTTVKDSTEEVQIYDFPADFLVERQASASEKELEEWLEKDAKRLAGVRLEDQQATRILCSGTSTSRRLVPGFRITLTDVGGTEIFDKEYLLLRLRHSAAQPQVLDEEAPPDSKTSYLCSFECIPASVPFRPPRITPRPSVQGVQTAIVVGPADEKLYMDELGRAKVKFHWDLRDPSDETSSCWIRVSTLYAGEGHGIQFHPLVGDEVIVDFIDGDPDRPLIVGRVYDGKNKPPLKPDDRIQNVVLTPYKHRLMLDDKKAEIVMNTGGSQKIQMGDAGGNDSKADYITLLTSNNHMIQMYKDQEKSYILLITEEGASVELKDKPDGEAGIKLTDKTGKLVIHMDSNSKEIRISGGHQKAINLTTEGGPATLKGKDITIEGSSSVTIKAPTINVEGSGTTVKGTSTLTAEGGTTTVKGNTKLDATSPKTTLEGTGAVEVKGGTAKVGGSTVDVVGQGGPVTVTGSLVKLNA